LPIKEVQGHREYFRKSSFRMLELCQENPALPERLDEAVISHQKYQLSKHVMLDSGTLEIFAWWSRQNGSCKILLRMYEMSSVFLEKSVS
jgi:hypothetical protein